MPRESGLPTHSCERCGRALWQKWWPYSLCQMCCKLPCKHGNKHGECAQCDAESDIAFDTKREDKRG